MRKVKISVLCIFAAAVGMFFDAVLVHAHVIHESPIDDSGQPAKQEAKLIKSYTKIEREKIYASMGRRSDSAFFGEPIMTAKDQEWRELDMDLLIKKLDRTYSAAGSAQFRMLMQPVGDCEQLKCRAELFKKLLDDGLFLQLDKLVKIFALRHENMLIHLLDDNHGKAFDTSEVSVSSQLTSVKAKLMLHLLSTLLMAQSLAVEVRHLRGDVGEILDRRTGWGMRGWLGYNVLTQMGGLGLGAYYTGTSFMDIVSKIPQVDDFVLKMGTLLELVKKMADTLAALPPALSDSIPSLLLQEFSDLRERHKKFESILIKIKTRRDAQEAARLCTGISPCKLTAPLMKYWHMLDSLDAYDDLYEFRHSFVKILDAVGTLDAYLSVARLYREWQAAGLPIAFATFSSGRRGEHELVGLFNPLVDRSVPNDFTLGGLRTGKHAILTGPHACGKTTSMKSIAYGYILGQSLTIVPAKKAFFVPVTKIKTSLNIGDNLTEGLSSFTAEHKRLDELLRAIRNLDPLDRCLMLVDEPLAKTIQIIGEPRVTDFIRKASLSPQLMLLVATHFEEPSHLEKETHGLIKNFQPELLAQEGGTFRPTYKIVDGPALWWFNDKERRSAFIDWLTKQR